MIAKTFAKVAARTVVLLWMAAPAASQNGPVQRLTQPERVAAGAFTEVAGLRELSDGRVIIADPRERRIVLLSADLSGSTEIGRQGEGPGEFQLPAALLALPNDTTLVVDRQNDRIMVLNPEVEAVGFVNLGRIPACRGAVSVNLSRVIAADASTIVPSRRRSSRFADSYREAAESAMRSPRSLAPEKAGDRAESSGSRFRPRIHPRPRSR